MSKKRKKIDPNQLTFDFEFDKQVDRYVRAKEKILESIESSPSTSPAENEFEACVEIAAAIKRALRESGLSRDQLVDAINVYFSRTKEGVKSDPPTCRNPLTLNMLNNYLSKPSGYPIPAYYLYAVHHVTGSLEPASIIVSAENAKIATGVELRHMTLGRLDEAIKEMQKLKRELSRK